MVCITAVTSFKKTFLSIFPKKTREEKDSTGPSKIYIFYLQFFFRIYIKKISFTFFFSSLFINKRVCIYTLLSSFVFSLMRKDRQATWEGGSWRRRVRWKKMLYKKKCVEKILSGRRIKKRENVIRHIFPKWRHASIGKWWDAHAMEKWYHILFVGNWWIKYHVYAIIQHLNYCFRYIECLGP